MSGFSIGTASGKPCPVPVSTFLTHVDKLENVHRRVMRMNKRLENMPTTKRYNLLILSNKGSRDKLSLLCDQPPEGALELCYDTHAQEQSNFKVAYCAKN